MAGFRAFDQAQSPLGHQLPHRQPRAPGRHAVAARKPKNRKAQPQPVFQPAMPQQMGINRPFRESEAQPRYKNIFELFPDEDSVGVADFHDFDPERKLLVISCVGLPVLVMAAVFVMLTRFRPHLQGPKEYFEWLKDERRFRIQTIQTVEVRETENASLEGPVSGGRRVTRHRTRSRTATTFHLSNLEGAELALAALNRLGFPAQIYRRYEDDETIEQAYEVKSEEAYGEKSKHAAIWVGAKVPPRDAAASIKAVIKIWPHLRFMSIPGDRWEGQPEEIDHQVFFGGATNTAIEDGLSEWTRNEIEAIPDDLPLQDFHKLIRAKYQKFWLSPSRSDGPASA